MNHNPLMACGPGAEILYPIFAILGASVLSFVAGVLCLCFGSKSLGALLTGIPITLFGALYFWIALRS